MKLVRAKKNLTHQYHNKNAIFGEDEINNILVYPNPNKGCFNIDFGNNSIADYSLIIFNIEGKQIFSLNKISSSIIEINIENYPKGSYILNLFNNKYMTVTTHKIIIQ